MPHQKDSNQQGKSANHMGDTDRSSDENRKSANQSGQQENSLKSAKQGDSGHTHNDRMNKR